MRTLQDRIGEIIYNELGFSKEECLEVAEKITDLPELKAIPLEAEVKPEIALSGRLEYEKLEEVAAQRTKELREYMEQFKNDKGQTIYEALQQ